MPTHRPKIFEGTRFLIDRPKGYVKVWPRPDGGEKRFQYPCDYGYFQGLKGEDDEGLDAFVGDKPQGHFEVFQKLKPGTHGGMVLDETKFLVGVSDAEREIIYRLYGDEIHSRRVFRDMAHLRGALEKFTPKKKDRYAMDNEKTALSIQKPFARVRDALGGFFSAGARVAPSAHVARGTQVMRGAFPSHLPTLSGGAHVPTVPQRVARPVSGPNGTLPLSQTTPAHTSGGGFLSAERLPTAPAPSFPPPLPKRISPDAQPFSAATGVARQRVAQRPSLRGVSPEQAAALAKIPRASQRGAGGIGNILPHHAEFAAAMQKDPKIRQYMANASPSERDALMHMLQQRGGAVNQFKVRQAMRDPLYANLAQYLKTGSLRTLASRGVFARLKTADEGLGLYRFMRDLHQQCAPQNGLSKSAREVLARYKLSDLKRADIDKLIRGHIVAAPNSDRQTEAEEAAVDDRLSRVFDRADARTGATGAESSAGQLPLSAEVSL